MTPERVELPGTAYERATDSIPDTVPEDIEQSVAESRFVKTDIGVFVTRDGRVEEYIEPFAQLRIDWDDYAASDKQTVELIKTRDVLLYEGDIVQNNQLKSGSIYRINMTRAREVISDLGVVEDEDILVRVEDTIWANVANSDTEALEFLAEKYDNPIFEDDFDDIDNYPRKRQAYVLKRIADTTMEQRAILSQQAIDMLCDEQAIQQLHSVGPPPASFE